MKNKLTVGLLFGGKSGEHEVSIRSAQSIYKALDKSKYNIKKILIDKKGRGLIEEPGSLALIDVFFPITHGTFGEDGSLQGFLELLNKPYVGAGVLGSAVGMDKDVMKRLLIQNKIPVTKYFAAKKYDVSEKFLNRVVGELDLPLFVKPANLGSSVGVTKVSNKKELDRAVKTAFQFDTKILFEQAVVGREIEVSVLGNDKPVTSLPGEIIPQHDFYSYEAKYIDENGAALEIPAKLSPKEIKQAQNMAIRVFQSLECSGMARVDFFLTDSGKFIVNEINTLPGFTSISMYPKLWEATKLTFSKLLDRLIALSLERFKEKSSLKRSYT